MNDRREADEGNSRKQIVWVMNEKNTRVRTREQNNEETEDDVPGMDLGAAREK